MPMSTKRKAPAKLAAPVARAAATLPTKNTIDESRTSVLGTDTLPSSQMETIEISSDNDDEDEDDSDGASSHGGDRPGDAQPAEDAASSGAGAAPATRLNGLKRGGEESDGEPTSPSFGELLRDGEVIDVAAVLQQGGAANGAVAPRPRAAAIVPPSHQSLTTVLSQALRTDDTDLLESCLHTTDLNTVRNTIERIDSSLAGLLLTKLTARLHRRPGRAGSLMTWVQWTLVSHGGALVSQPKLVNGLGGLQKVLAERAKGLNSLLALKGKLDLLDGQMELRRRMKRAPGLWKQDGGDDDGGADDDVVWVEGEVGSGSAARRKRSATDDDDDDDDDAPVTNGFAGELEDDERDSDVDSDSSDGSGSDPSGSDADADEPMDDDDVDDDDVDESPADEDESEAEAAPPPAKAQKVSRTSQPRRK